MTPLSDSEAATVARFENAEPAPESWGGTCQRQEDAYVPPRYPVDEPPTYRAQCSCGWSGPERYRGITDGDWSGHVRDGRDGLREAMIDALADTVGRQVPQGWVWRPDPVVDAVLALPELAALRAKADAADRVRELHRRWPNDLPICVECSDEITVGWPCPTIDALDGPSPC